MRTRNAPSTLRANSHAPTAAVRLPRCRGPVGEGAKRPQACVVSYREATASRRNGRRAGLVLGVDLAHARMDVGGQSPCAPPVWLLRRSARGGRAPRPRRRSGDLPPARRRPSGSPLRPGRARRRAGRSRLSAARQTGGGPGRGRRRCRRSTRACPPRRPPGRAAERLWRPRRGRARAAPHPRRRPRPRGRRA